MLEPEDYTDLAKDAYAYGPRVGNSFGFRQVGRSEDANDLGEPIFDKNCTVFPEEHRLALELSSQIEAYLERRRREYLENLKCNRCFAVRPRAGWRWCVPCAIKNAEALIANGEGSEMTAGRIEALKTYL